MFQELDQEPVVKLLTLDPVEIKDDHFRHPLDGSDSSRGGMNFPIPEVRYLIKEISVVWHLYGGKDFGSVTFTASPTRSRGWASNRVTALTVFNMHKGKQTCLMFYTFVHFAGQHLTAPPLKPRSDKPKLLDGREVEEEETQMY